MSKALWLPCLLGLVVALAGAGAGCLPDPRVSHSIQLLERLVAARAMLADVPTRREEGCALVGDVQTRLFGEPGLIDVRPGWTALRDAAGALQAACGQSTLLDQPSTDSQAAVQARQRWRQGIQREIAIACDHLRTAATALSHTPPC